jgi:hypothetical protein
MTRRDMKRNAATYEQNNNWDDLIYTGKVMQHRVLFFGFRWEDRDDPAKELYYSLIKMYPVIFFASILACWSRKEKMSAACYCQRSDQRSSRK